ncbi:MAG: CotH kinase family protein [Bacteroidales bacterium]|nr:CotH kinase family protein [Bacteroidales bacterium]
MRLSIRLLKLFSVLFIFYAINSKGQDILTTSNLPIVVINTGGNCIVPDSNITADMGIIYNGPGSVNHISNPFNNYDGKIGIRCRGNTSLSFPKKSYSVETQDSLGQNLNVSLIDLPSENDWVFYGPYSDKSLMRNALIFQLARKLGWYASRTKYCELILDSTYQGVYVFTEKIKEDEERVDIATLSPNDTIGDELTGGYMIQVDRWDGDGWFSNFTQYTYFEYYEPDDDDILPVQKAYIQNYINDFEFMLDTLTIWDHELIDSSINLKSFYDYLILNELAKNVDAYRLSTYMFKDKDSKDGRLTMGPIWDYNIAFGNCDYYDGFLTSGYIYSDSIYNNYALFWFKKLMEFEPFQDSLKCRWELLRNSSLHMDSISASIDSIQWLLDEPNERNFIKWNILGQYVWPNYFVGETYEEEVDYLKEWIEERMAWLDNNLPGDCPTSSGSIKFTNGQLFIIYPNPFKSELRIKFNNKGNNDLQFSIFDLQGREVYQINLKDPVGNEVALSNIDIEDGLYFYRIILNRNAATSGKILKY